MQHSLMATLFLMAFVSTSTIQAAPVRPTIDTRPAYCPGVTAKNDSYIRRLAVYTVRLGGSVTLPINLTYEDWATTKRRVLEAYEDSNYTPCLEYPSPITPRSSTPAVCSSQYQCDYDPGRFPPYIPRVVCKGEQVNYSRNNQPGQCQCKPILRPLTVLRFVGCDPYEQWRMEQQVVSVGCSCVNIQ